VIFSRQMNKKEHSYRINPRISLLVNPLANSNMRMIARCFKTMFGISKARRTRVFNVNTDTDRAFLSEADLTLIPRRDSASRAIISVTRREERKRQSPLPCVLPLNFKTADHFQAPYASNISPRLLKAKPFVQGASKKAYFTSGRITAITRGYEVITAPELHSLSTRSTGCC